MTVPYSFGAATSAIPLSQLDSNFNTPITLGNTAIQLGNTVTTLNNMTLANVTISSGNVTITNVTVTTANVTTGNVTNLISGNVSLTGGSITGTPISGSTGSFTTLTTSSTVTLNGGTANGVAYLNASNVLTTGSALTFDGTTFATTGAANFATSSGNVGIGLSSPIEKLSVNGGIVSTFAANLSSGAGAYLYYTSGTTSAELTALNPGVAWLSQKYNALTHIWNNSGSEQMRLTSTGLGIGTSSPGYKLDVAGSSRIGGDSPYLYIQDTVNPASDVGVYFGAPSAATYAGILTNFASDQLLFRHNSATRMTLDSSGNLGIGTSSPSTYSLAPNLVVQATTSGGVTVRSATTGYGGIFFADGTTGDEQYRGFIQYNHGFSSPNDAMIFGTAGSSKATLDSSGNLGLGVTPSAWSGQTAFQLVGSAAIASSNQYLDIQTNSYYNAGSKYIGTGLAARYTQAAGVHQWFTAASGTAGNAITFTQAMTLDASGNLLVGTTTANGKLSVYATTNAQLALTDSTLGANYGGVVRGYGTGGVGGFAELGVLDNAVYTKGVLVAQQANNIQFYTGVNTAGNAERARITSGGSLLVGTASAIWNSLEKVAASNASNAPCFSGYQTGGAGNDVYVSWNSADSGTRQHFRFADSASGATRGTITTDGANTAYNTSSDYRLKDNQQPLIGSGAFIDALQPKTWDWKETGKRGVGFIAHEVQAVSPGSVVGEKDAVDEEGKPIMQAMEYGSAEFIANIVAELQSLRARVAQLESKGA